MRCTLHHLGHGKAVAFWDGVDTKVGMVDDWMHECACRGYPSWNAEMPNSECEQHYNGRNVEQCRYISMLTNGNAQFAKSQQFYVAPHACTPATNWVIAL